MKLANTTIKSSQKYPYRIPLFTMIRIIAAIQLIYNKKIQHRELWVYQLRKSI